MATTLNTAVSTLEANLAALAVSSPDAARAIRAEVARSDIEFIQTPEGAESAVLSEFTMSGLIQRALASKKKPLSEAAQLTERIDVTTNAAVVITGFSLGYHVAAVARKMKQSGVVIVYEPDVALLRAVFERIDHSEWIRQTNLLLLVRCENEADLAGILQPIEAMVAMGVATLDHPPSQPRLGDDSKHFIATFARVMQSIQTTVTTTMVQTQASVRNVTQNLDHYTLGPGILDLQQSCVGLPAIIVSAGPSLRRNIDLLSTPGIREHVVIIAVQTVLKQLLAKGIRPHFVCALDYHEISRRFYEGLTKEDVAGVTLVVEPKVNPAVTSAYPGLIRCCQDSWLDELLGHELSRPMGYLPDGATVAHLCYYLARFLGCDPAILIGQDLGFTDGQYYAPNASIHETWAPELNELHTLESLEWQRIVRHRGNLQARTDVLGRHIYTDQQMESYLMQFQRDFKRDAEFGLTTIDATEGGVAKLHTTPMTLSDALAQVSGRAALPPIIAHPPGMQPRDERRAAAVMNRLATIQRDASSIADQSRRTTRLLDEMLERQNEQTRVNTLIQRVHEIAEKVRALDPAFGLVQRLNQTGAFNRTRADRAINTNTELDAMEVQRRQIQRDRTNVTWIGDAADALATMMAEARLAMRTGEKVTRDVSASASKPVTAGAAAAKATLGAVVVFREGTSALGHTTDPTAQLLPGYTALHLTLTRLLRCRHAGLIFVLAQDTELARRCAGPLATHGRIRFVACDRPPSRYAPATLRAMRTFARHSWRGAPLTVFDELVDLGLLAAVLEEHKLPAAILCASDWSLLDPLMTEVICDRYLEDPVAHRMSFSQAGPGLVPCVLDVNTARHLAKNAPTTGIFASLGGILGYVPVAASADMIAKSMCVQVSPTVRDLPLRAIFDTPADAARLLKAIASDGLDPLTCSAEETSKAVTRHLFNRDHAVAPEHLTLQLADLRRERVMPTERAIELINEFATITSSRGTLTLHDPLLHHAGLLPLLSHARTQLTGALHLRSTFARAGAPIAELTPADGPAPADIISFDLVADAPDVHARLLPEAGMEGFTNSRVQLQELLNRRREDAGVHVPFVVPRMVRRDETYEHVEPVVDSCVMLAGWCVLDPLDAPVAGDRIEPLTPPTLARRRRHLTALTMTPENRDSLHVAWRQHLIDSDAQ